MTDEEALKVWRETRNAYARVIQAAFAEREAANPWRTAVIDELCVCHIYNDAHDADPQKAMRDAIAWNVKMALDPAVSEDLCKLLQEREAAKDAEIAALQAEVAELVKEKAAYDKAINLAYTVGYLQGKADSGKTTTLPGGLLETVGTEPPPGCHCGEVCMAPKVMGRQMPCRRRPEILNKHGASNVE